MKKQLLLFCLLFNSLSFAQNFAPLGAVWYYGSSYMMPGEGFVTFESTQDTLVSGKNCRLLNQSSSLYCINRPLTVPVYDENNIVYFWDNNRDVFETLYDFNKQVGESWQIIATSFFSSNLDTITVTVQAKSIVTLNGVDLIAMDVLYQNIYPDNMQIPSTIYERIGDLDFLFNHYTDLEAGACDNGSSNGLRCYSDNSFGFYTTNPNKACDYNTLSVQENSLENLIISPNPSDGKIKLDSDLMVDQVLVYNAFGELIFIKKYSQEINFSDLNSGIYFLEFQTEDGKGNVRKKLVIE